MHCWGSGIDRWVEVLFYVFSHGDKSCEKHSNAISLLEHHHRLTTYELSSAVQCMLLCKSTPLSPQPSPSSVAEQVLLWFVRIAPGECLHPKVSFVV